MSTCVPVDRSSINNYYLHAKFKWAKAILNLIATEKPYE